MTKLRTLVHVSGNTSIGNIPWIKEKMLSHYNVEPFDPVATYNPSTHIMVIDRYDSIDSGWHIPFKERGFKVIVEYFWDSSKQEQSTVQDNTLNIRVKEWVWIDGHLMRKYVGNQYRPQLGDPDKFFLMLMGLARDTRDLLLKKMTPYLNDSLYSYRGRGVVLQGDDMTNPDVINQHFSNNIWYNSTNFSLVAETLPIIPNAKEQLFVSEKTFKPIIMNHPFIVHGSSGTLNYLHSMGFETFDHIIDESYDQGETVPVRLEAICRVLDVLYREFKQGKRLFGDTESQHRINHNFHRYYNTSIIDQLWKTQLLDVIQEFIDA